MCICVCICANNMQILGFGGVGGLGVGGGYHWGGEGGGCGGPGTGLIYIHMCIYIYTYVRIKCPEASHRGLGELESPDRICIAVLLSNVPVLKDYILVGGFNPSEKIVSWGYYSQYMEKMFQTTNQISTWHSICNSGLRDFMPHLVSNPIESDA